MYRVDVSKQPSIIKPRNKAQLCAHVIMMRRTQKAKTYRHAGVHSQMYTGYQVHTLNKQTAGPKRTKKRSLQTRINASHDVILPEQQQRVMMSPSSRCQTSRVFLTTVFALDTAFPCLFFYKLSLQLICKQLVLKAVLYRITSGLVPVGLGHTQE